MHAVHGYIYLRAARRRVSRKLRSHNVRILQGQRYLLQINLFSSFDSFVSLFMWHQQVFASFRNEALFKMNQQDFSIFNEYRIDFPNACRVCATRKLLIVKYLDRHATSRICIIFLSETSSLMLDER